MDKDVVICEICKREFKEINNFHLSLHGMDAKMYDKKYPNSKRLSHSSLEGKNHFKILTKEMSKKLKHAHTIEGYIEKYGQIMGTKKFNESKDNKIFSRSLKGYIKRYGKIEGTKLHKEHNMRRAVTLEGLIKKHGTEKGNKIYENWLNKNTLYHYTEIYGEEEGTKRWISKYNKQSKKVRRIPVERVNEYCEYKRLVDRYTRLSITKFKLDMIEKRGTDYQLDHKVSICYGFLHNINPLYIGSIYNLEIVPTSINASKQEDCSMNSNVLIEKTNNNKFYSEINIEK